MDQIPTLRDLFPCYSRRNNGGSIPWNIHWSEADFPTLLRRMEEDVVNSFNADENEFEAFSTAISNEILFAKNREIPHQLTTILDFLQFSICIHIAERYLGLGRFSLAFDWICNSASDTITDEIERSFDPGIPNRFIGLNNVFSMEDIIASIFKWISAISYCSSHWGGFSNELFSVLALYSNYIICIASRDLFGNEHFDKLSTQTICSIHTWCTKYENPHETAFWNCLVAKHKNTDYAAIKQLISLQFALHSKGTINKSPSEWADEALISFAQSLNELEKLQLSSVSIMESPDRFNREIENYNKQIQDFVRNTFASDPVKDIYIADLYVDIIKPCLFYSLSNHLFSHAISILNSYFKGSVNHQETVLICPSGLDTAWICAEGFYEISERGNGQGYKNLISEMNSFMNSTIAFQGDMNFKLNVPAPNEFGHVNTSLSDTTEKTLEAHYGFSRAKVLPPAIKSMIVFPGIIHPIQPLMIKNLGYTFPINSSLQKPAIETSPIRKALLWCIGTQTSNVECRIVTKILKSAGIGVETVDVSEMTKQNFLSYYSSPSYDLIWVASHGFYNYSRPEISFLKVIESNNDDDRVSLQDLLHITPNNQHQRTLFLNVCDGAQAVSSDSKSSLGFSAALSGPNQAVISHIWPVNDTFALLYGTLLAIFITDEMNSFQAYVEALQTVLKGNSAIIDLFNAKGILNEFPDSNLRRDYSDNLYYWGGPAYFI